MSCALPFFEAASSRKDLTRNQQKTSLICGMCWACCIFSWSPYVLVSFFVGYECSLSLLGAPRFLIKRSRDMIPLDTMRLPCFYVFFMSVVNFNRLCCSCRGDKVSLGGRQCHPRTDMKTDTKANKKGDRTWEGT